MKQQSERRAFGRVTLPFAGTATFDCDGEPVQVPVETKDVSSSGGYFQADSCPGVGGEIHLSLRWPPEGHKLEMSLTTTGVVVRVDSLGDDTHGFAVKFAGNPTFKERHQQPSDSISSHPC